MKLFLEKNVNLNFEQFKPNLKISNIKDRLGLKIEKIFFKPNLFFLNTDYIQTQSIL